MGTYERLQYGQYRNFWNRPFETPTMWIGLLYAILAIGARFQASRSEDHGTALQGDSMHSAHLSFYREKCVQALILANYTKCPPFTIETCILYIGSELVRSSDAQFSICVLVGMIVRMGFRMGYHRDPSRFANISPFRGELRRRSWLVLLSLDLISSSQIGLPRIIQPFMYDTKEPRNLEEEDLHEDMTELPPSRSETQLTPLLYTIVLTRVRKAFAKIADLTNTTSQPAYREIMDMDADLRQVYEKIPDTSKLTEVDTVETPASMRRLYLGLSFMKAELMLHRPFLLLGRTDPTYGYSRRVCINAAFEMLELQQKLDAEIRPGGKLWSPGWHTFTMSWYMSSIVAQDFLLATTVMVLDLDQDLSSPLTPAHEQPMSGLKLDHTPPSREQSIEILRGAQNIWHKASERSHEARKVAEAIRVVLNKAYPNEPMPAPATGKLVHSYFSLMIFRIKLLRIFRLSRRIRRTVRLHSANAFVRLARL
jgi:hypothetical protein